MPIGVGPSPGTGGTPRKTLSNLRTAVRDNVDEATAAFWTNAQLLRFINRAKDRVWVEVRKLKDDFFLINRTSLDGSLTILGSTYDASSFRLVATTKEYTLPSDVVELKLIECITSGYESTRFTFADLASSEVRDLRTLTENQSPVGFLVDLVGERTFSISPATDTTLDLRIWYVPILGDLAEDADTMEMPHPLYMAVEAYATASAHRMDRNFAAAVQWEAIGRALIMETFGATARQTQDPEFVVGYLHDVTGA